ncbi:MAG: serine/threonine protein kinase [Myxococcales bacterium]|nr:serine/threonine protein kinase [Myxococcales bacterium]
MTEKKKPSENEKLSLDAPDASLFPALYDEGDTEQGGPSPRKTMNPNKDTFTKGLKGLVDPKQFLEADSSPNTTLQPPLPQPPPSRLRLGFHDGPVPTQGELNAVTAPLTEIAPEPLSGSSWERWSGSGRVPYSSTSSPAVPSALQDEPEPVFSSGNYQTYAETVREQYKNLRGQAEASSPADTQDPYASLSRALADRTAPPRVTPHEVDRRLGVRGGEHLPQGNTPSSTMWPAMEDPELPDDGTFSAAFWAIVEDVPLASDDEPSMGGGPTESNASFHDDIWDPKKRSPSGGHSYFVQEDAPPEDLRKSASTHVDAFTKQAFSAKEHEVQMLRSAQPTDEMPSFTLWPEREDISPQRTPSSTMWPSLGESTTANAHPNSPSSAFWALGDAIEPAHSQKSTLPTMKAAPDLGDLPVAPQIEDDSPIFLLEKPVHPSTSSSYEEEEAKREAHEGRAFLDLTDVAPELELPALPLVGHELVESSVELHDPVFAPPSFLPAVELPHLDELPYLARGNESRFGNDTHEEARIVGSVSYAAPRAQGMRRQEMPEYTSGSDESLSMEHKHKRRSSPSYADLDVVRKLQAMWMLPPELQAYEHEHSPALGDTGIHPMVGLEISHEPIEHNFSDPSLVLLEQQILPSMPPSERRQTIFPLLKKTPEGDAIQRRTRPRYESIQVMSEDAMWQIELVRDFDLKRNVAMKRLKPDMHVPHAVLRMAEEVQIMAALAHPNIPEIHDVGIDEKGQYYFVMEHLKGETMRSIIKKLASGDVRYHKRFPLQTRLFIFRELVRAVEYAHRKGVLHRNLNPAHVVVGARDEVKLLGWELAHKFQAMGQDPEPLGAEAMDAIFTPLSPIPGFVHSEVFRTRDGRIQGSPAYMAPEQIQNLAPLIDERSDVYGLSTIFYEWVGLRFYLGAKKTLDDLSEGIVYEEPIPLHQLNLNTQPRVPSAVSSFAIRGLQKDPNKRFASAAEMRAALEDVLAGGNGKQAGMLSYALRFFEERPIWFVSFLIFFACTLILSGVQISEWIRALWR